ncbi:MAG: hypothetical protein GOVbin4296_23 [Prokaryotic dsDNA virus sp.]|nr:MAG: hypothetical protein GOVbin4296_23 [Prokaryotic dsDNA virus sp.]|tara:strand:- start:1370 stop:1582 length:213 start_codon:yes stop_codon:yes gene_type:complete
MYLDETILQSRTTATLVEYIDELWEFLEVMDCQMKMKDLDTFMDIQKKYHEIKKQSNKALLRREMKYRKE